MLETYAIRQKIIDNYALPVVKEVFHKYPQINSACFAVARHRDDYGLDRIHDFILYSVLEAPDWESFAKSEQNDKNYLQKDNTNLPDFQENHHHITYGIWEEVEKDSNFNYYDGCDPNILEAFDPFCVQNSHMNDNYSEAYSPYAFLTRTSKEIKIIIVSL